MLQICGIQRTSPPTGNAWMGPRFKVQKVPGTPKFAAFIMGQPAGSIVEIWPRHLRGRERKIIALSKYGIWSCRDAFSDVVFTSSSHLFHSISFSLITLSLRRLLPLPPLHHSYGSLCMTLTLLTTFSAPSIQKRRKEDQNHIENCLRLRLRLRLRQPLEERTPAKSQRFTIFSLSLSPTLPVSLLSYL